MNPFTTLVLITFACGIAATARAQARLDWSRTHATPGSDAVYAVEVDAAGNVYAAGFQNGDVGLVHGTAFVSAWDAAGTLLWSRTYDSPLGNIEIASSIAFDGAGGLYVVGASRGATAASFATFLLHIDAAGAITWSVEQPVTAEGLSGAWRPALTVDGSGRAIVGDRGPTGSGDLEITAYTPAGVVAWQTTYAGAAGGVDRVVDLAFAPNGDIVALGDVNSPSASSNTGSPVLVRLAPNGALLQSLEIVHSQIPHGFGVDVEIDAQGRIFVAASSRPAIPADRSIVTLAFDASFGLSWVRSIGGPPQLFAGGAWAAYLEPDPFGRMLVLGTRAQGYAGYALVVAAYDVNGNEVWREDVNDVLGGSNVEIYNSGYTLLLDANGETTAVGTHAPADQVTVTQSDAFAYGIDAAGVKRFGFVHGYPGSALGSLDYGFAAASGPAQSFVIAGQTQTGDTVTGFEAYVARFTRTAVGFCHGDGATSPCPCGNVSAPAERAGCASTLGVGGRLADLGSSSLSSDTLVLVGSSMTDANANYFQGTLALAGTPFGDGLLCAGGANIRLGIALNSAGASHYPESGDPPVSVRGLVGAPGIRTYQVVYRNAAVFCTPSTFNSTNGLQVTWTP